MTAPVSSFLLEDCFFNPLDQGVAAEQTPLLTGIFERTPLAEVLCHRFGISLEQAELEITAARNEVQL